MLSGVKNSVYIMGGFDGYECLRDAEVVNLDDSEP